MSERVLLNDCAKTAGADLLGVADVGRFSGLPERLRPETIFPETRSVIVVGRRITRGTLRGVEEGTNFGNYALYGYDWLENRFLSLTTFQIAEFLEDRGWEAVPLSNLPPEVPPMGVSVAPGRPEPNVMLDFVDAAVRAGVGEIGWCRVLLTPRFGPRQRIQVILTDAELEPDPLLESPICPRTEACRGYCPIGALGGEETVEILGKKMAVAAVDWSRCAVCNNGAHPNIHHPAGKVDRIAAACLRGCADFLERAGRISNTFHMPFRKRPVWVIKPETRFFTT